MISGQTLRKSLKWFGLLLLLSALGAGGYAYWLWNHCDEYLLSLLVQKQQELVPDWDVKIGRAHFDWHRRVRIYDVKIKAKGQENTILTLPEVVIAINRKLFETDQKIEIESVRVINPLVELHRDAQGTWDWHALLTLQSSERSLPEWFIEQGTLQVQYDQTDNRPPTKITLSDADLKLIPSGKRQFTLLGQADFNEAGKVAIKGDWNVDAKSWTVTGQLADIQRGGELLPIAAGVSPEFREAMAEFNADLERTRIALTPPEETRVALRPNSRLPIESSVEPPPFYSGSHALPDFGLESAVDVKFTVSQTAPETEWDIRAAVELKQGTISHAVLPFPLRGVDGEVYWDDKQIEFRNLVAQNGTTRVALSGKLDRTTPHVTGQLDLEVTNLLLDPRLRGRLPASLREQYDTVQPSGLADVSLSFHREPGTDWEPRDFFLTAKNCGFLVREFAYPVSDITGTMKQTGDDYKVDLTGVAGGRKVDIKGEIKSPGPEAETWFAVKVPQFPLDDRFRQACDPEMRAVLDDINIAGWADVHFQMYRPQGLDQPFQTLLKATLANCEVLSKAFPYRVTNLSGIVTYRSDKKLWTFEEFQGQHEMATLTAKGNFDQAVAPGELKMTITTKGAALDESLYQALPDSAKTVWANFAPSGKVDTTSVIRWVPNMGFEWGLPQAVVYDARMKLKAFPLALSDVRAEWSYIGNTCKITDFTARHDDTRFRGKGIAIVPPQGRWEVKLLDLFVDDLSPDRELRQALPSGVRTIIEELDPKDPFSLSGGIWLSGTEKETDPVTASWNLDFVFTGNQLYTGIELKNVHGQVRARGTWDGKDADNAGWIELESVEVLGYQLTQVKGPYSVAGNQITIGSSKVFDSAVIEQTIPRDERLTAQAIEGTLTYDAEVFLDEEVRYRSRLNLINGRLEEYARRYLPGTENLSGVMNGWLNFSGQGVDTQRMVGTGQLRISPAALYELPILAQVFQEVFQVLALTARDKTAFRQALVDFDISKNQFVFKTIDLAGDSLSFRGKGTAGFDGRLEIDFYSLLPRAQLPRWPVVNLVNPVLDQATKDWVRVEVRGKTSRPDVKLKPVPVMEDTIKRFLGILGTGAVGKGR